MLIIVLIPMAILRRVESGEVDRAFRKWTRPTVKAGGTLRTAIGLLAIMAVEPLSGVEAITDLDARRAGSENADEIRALLAKRDAGTVYRITFRMGGDDPRTLLRENDAVTDAELEEIRTKLDRLDQRAADGPWTRATLQIIADRPETRAGDLAEALGRARLPFKTDVRKLKALGLTESLEVGYCLSPRGREVFARL